MNIINPIRYNFFGKSLSESSNNLESRIIDLVRDSGLEFFRTEGLIRSDFYELRCQIVYRLSSKAHHAYAEFTLHTEGGRIFCNVLMLYIVPADQGNGFSLKDFALNCFAKTLFEAGIDMIGGTASLNTHPVRKKPNGRRDFRTEKTKDGTPKLVRLYEFLGFTRYGPNSDVVTLTRDAFLSTGNGSRDGFVQGTAVESLADNCVHSR